jgi:hypothetical protein
MKEMPQHFLGAVPVERRGLFGLLRRRRRLPVFLDIDSAILWSASGNCNFTAGVPVHEYTPALAKCHDVQGTIDFSTRCFTFRGAHMQFAGHVAPDLKRIEGTLKITDWTDGSPIVFKEFIDNE